MLLPPISSWHAPSVNRFTAVAGAVVVLEAVLGAWPVVATSIWGSRAVDTWIHFLYWIKAIFLLLAVVQYRWTPWHLAPRRLQGKPDPNGTTASGDGVPLYRPSVFERFMGLTTSCELATWILISLVAHALLSAIVLLLVLVLQNEFLSNTQWVLSVVFDAVGILESVASPIIVTTWSIPDEEAPFYFGASGGEEVPYRDGYYRADAGGQYITEPPTRPALHPAAPAHAQKHVRFGPAGPRRALSRLQQQYGLDNKV